MRIRQSQTARQPARGLVFRAQSVSTPLAMAEDQLFAKKAIPPPDGGAGTKGQAAPAKTPAYYARRKRRHNEICQILIRNGDVTPDVVRKALKVQEDRGGQIGRILVKRGHCTERALANALRIQVELSHEAGAPRNLATLARKNPAIAGLGVACSPTLTGVSLLICDVITCLAIAAVATGCDYVATHHLSPSLLHYGFPALALSVLVLSALGSHRPIAQSPPDEIRTTTSAVTIVFASVALVAMFRWEAIPWRMHAILAFEWALACFLLPVVRALVRQRLSRLPWWGVPVVVLGAGKTGRALVRALRARPQLGLRPVLVLDDDAKKLGSLTASLGEDEDIEVHTRRDVPVASVSSADLASSSSFIAARALAAFADAKPSVPALERRARTTEDVSPIDHAPHTIRSPSPPPPEPEGSEAMEAPRRNSGIVESAPRLPDAGPSSPSLAGLAGLGPASSSSRRHDPSWLHQMPDSIRGLVRGQFAEIDGVPIVGALEIAPLLAERLGISYGIVAMPGQNARKLLQVTERVGGAFPHLLVIPDLIGFASLGVPAREIAGVVGIEVRQQLLLRGPRVAKRLMDLVLTLVGGIFAFPIIVLLALIIRLDSKGSAFYSQERLGRSGKLFIAHKFRTMHGDGEERLKAVLEADPKMRAEYDEFHKLSFDPRITRVGRVLRKYSLDELPQLLNVVRGEMSLVGPRPYLQRELPSMSNHEHIILRSVPGMTGLWQVGDRNSTGFAERLKMDMHYVKNWSPWLDLYVLARTVGVVFGGTGS
jgi:lipopolysaccharide/colanic/teichoic acid biosynthesis glycosyltransferase